MTRAVQRNRGYTYVELLAAVALGALLIAGLSGLVGNTLDTRDAVQDKSGLTRQAGEAMQRMRRAVAHSRRLLLPLADNPNTDWPEHIREQTVPASAPLGSSTLATAVLAVTLPAYVDLDRDGRPDADNDGDGRLDEDVIGDLTRDGAPGVLLIDDNGDGSVDDSTAVEPTKDNDEDDYSGEDHFNGLDDDGDGSVDEDPRANSNADGSPGRVGIDDDGDGAIDEGNPNDDDEDGLVDEDSYEALLFYLDGSTLMERMPVPWDQDGSGTVDGRDFVLTPLVDQVSRFRVERVAPEGERAQLVELTLEVRVPGSGEVISLRAGVRVGGAL